MVYVLSAFQPGTHVSADNVYTDVDPNSERLLSAFGFTCNPEGGSFIFRAIHRESFVATPVAEEQDTVVHEVGHAMANSGAHPTSTAGRYSPGYIRLIRKAIKPWSE